MQAKCELCYILSMAKVKDVAVDAQIHHGRREKLRQLFNTHGLSAFNETQVLEYALGIAIPRIDTNPTAHRLMNAFGSLDGVIGAHPDKLSKVDGVGTQAAHFLHFLKQFVTYYLKTEKTTKKIKTSLAAIEHLRDVMKTYSVEEFVVLAMDKDDNLLLQQQISGSLNRVNINLRDIVDVVLRVKSASVIIAHNHACENVNPSAADIHLTRAIVNLLTPLEIDLMDHLIFCKTDAVYSFQKSGILNILKDEQRKFATTSAVL